MGPNVKRLIVHKLVMLMIPPGSKDPLADGVTALTKLGDSGMAKQATEWVEQAISAVKTAPDNPYGDDDEAIAGEIMRRVDERKGSL